MNAHEALKRAVTAIGGQSATAKALGVSPGLVWQWLNGRRPLPQEHCVHLESLSGVRCEELGPGIVWTRDQLGQITGYHVPIAGLDDSRRTTAAGAGTPAEADGTQVQPLKAA